MEKSSALAADLRALVGKLKRRLREQANVGDLTPSQTSVLLRLERDGPATVSALAKAAGVRHQSMRTTVAALEAGGYVEGHADPEDGRQTIISLTGAFRRRLSQGRVTQQDWLARGIDSKLSAAERKTLATAVALLDRIVGD